MVSSPRISKGPAGSCINRDSARRGWAAETGHPRRGARDPSENLHAFTARRHQAYKADSVGEAQTLKNKWGGREGAPGSRGWGAVEREGEVGNGT